jgi:hypothetical protein
MVYPLLAMVLAAVSQRTGERATSTRMLGLVKVSQYALRLLSKTRPIWPQGHAWWWIFCCQYRCSSVSIWFISHFTLSVSSLHCDHHYAWTKNRLVDSLLGFSCTSRYNGARFCFVVNARCRIIGAYMCILYHTKTHTQTQWCDVIGNDGHSAMKVFGC